MSAVTSQPAGAGEVTTSPDRLQYLSAVDKLILSQKVEVAETFVGFETANKYTVKNAAGQHVYFAVEESGLLMRNCCSYLRPFTLRIMDSSRREVLQLQRPLRCQACCFPGHLQQLEVTSGGQLLGTVRQQWSLLRPSFQVLLADGTEVLHVRGPACRWSAPSCISDFEILSADGAEVVGYITKVWAGLAKELFTDTDMYGIEFPEDADTTLKAILLGAAFLVDFMFFESGCCRGDCGCGMVC